MQQSRSPVGQVAPAVPRGAVGATEQALEPSTGVAAGDAVAESAAGVRAARGAATDALTALTVAEAKLREARDAEPWISPRLAAATQQAREAQSRVDRAGIEHESAVRAVQDCHGARTVAQAKLEDVTASTAESEFPVVAATEAVAKAARAVAAAEAAVDRAAREQEAAGDELATADEYLERVRQEPPQDSARVVQARLNVSKAKRLLNDAEQRADAAEQAHAQLEKSVAAGGSPSQVRPYFGSLEQFVMEYVLANWDRWPVPKPTEERGVRWCSRWWDHAEATARLGHVWEAFEVMRLEKAPSMATFWRDHLDYHMRVLTDPDGPFQRCSQIGDLHEVAPMWRSVISPEDRMKYDPDCGYEEVQRQREHATARPTHEDRAAPLSGPVSIGNNDGKDPR